ncbi:hypothetical protein QBC34DRAFT_416854 [Podospora aff. communis PSN243]|uniref:Uncharacterized protein n=1 Tax=Podospora aff. communis PSN243 TaxID=3040156 RepID=A0AAV9G4A3_9PEZI|nr:hypothetical protein QBC34DRAFT_416854 [Podospora aff. communis PSN243]
MAPLVPRMHLFEIDDMPWFPSFLRARVQAALTACWTTHVPILQSSSPAQLAARILSSNLGNTVRDYVYIDFCAGGGGPTPEIEKHLNQVIESTPSSSTSAICNGPITNGTTNTASYAAVAAAPPNRPVRFVLTDLHPHVDDWKKAASASPNLSYIPDSVDAAHAPADLVGRYKAEGTKVFRLFNLAFHHFDDPLAKAILKNTLETSDGFGIFELQERTFLGGFVSLLLFGAGILLTAPYYAIKWRSPATLFFTYIIPILPFVLVFDGWMSALRTRTPEEVEALLRTCGVEGGEEEVRKWEIRSGRASFMPPVGNLNWIVCVKK